MAKMRRRLFAPGFFLVFLALLSLRTASAEPPETQQQDEAKKVFVPTHEWQTIEEGQAIPAGLHVRMDLQTGKKEAKLMDPEDNKVNKLQGLTIIDTPRTPKNRGDSKESVDDPNANPDSSDLDSTGDLGTKIRFVNPEDASQTNKKKTWSQEDTMKMTLLSTGLLTGTIESRLEVLKSLEDEVHDLEQAEIFMGVGGVEALVSLANHTDEALASMAALVLGSTVQSHPKLQSKAVESNAVPVLVNLLERRLDAQSSEQTCNRALYALSALLRRTPIAQPQFEALQGPALLVKVFESLPVGSQSRVKVMLFVADLFSEDMEDKVSELDMHEQADQKGGAQVALHCLRSTNQQTETGVEKKDEEGSSNIQSQCAQIMKMGSGHWLGLGANGWCRAAVRQAQRVVSVDDAQKALEVLDALAPGCVHVYGTDTDTMHALGKLAEGWVEDAKTETDEQWKGLLEMPDSASEATGLGEEDQRDRMDMEDGQEGGSMGENPDQSPATPLSPVMQGPNYESLYGMGAASVFGGDVQNQMFESETSPREDWGGNGGQGQGDGGTPKVRSPDGNVQCGQRAEENRYRSWSGPDMRSAHKGDANNSPMRVMGWSPRSGVISPGPPAAYGQISPYYSVVQSPASMANTPGSRIDLLDVSTPGSLASPNPYLTPGAFQPTTPAALQPCDFGRHRHPLPPIPLEVPISEITPVMLDPMVVFSLRGEAQYSGVCPSRHVKGISPRPRAAIRNANCYTKDRMVGKGTFGEVFKGKDPTSGRLVALKKVLLPPDNELDGIPVTTIRELRFMSLVNHPNVLHLDEVCSTNPSSDGKLGHIYLVFEWMHHDLKGLIERHEVPMPPSQVKHYMRQLLEGLRFLHLHNIMHRDLKSSNVLVNNDGVLKIADFGLACKVDEVHEDKNMTFRAVTLWYRPPELLLEQARYDTQCDMWSAGCILGELLERTAILMGTTEIDQLDKIWQLCGTPNPHYWPYYGEYLSRRGVTFPHYERQVANRFRRKYEECPPLVNLLEALLQTNPDRRLSAEASLDHDAFWTDPMPRDNIAELRLEESHEMNVVGMIKRRMRASMSQQPMPNPRSGPHPSHHRGPMPQQGPPFHQNSHRPHPYNQNQQQHLGVRPHGARPPGPDQRGMHGRDSRGGSSHHGDWRGGGPKGPRPGNFHPGQPGPGHAGGQQHHNRSGSPHRQKPPPGQHPNQQQGPPNPQQGGPNPNFNRHRNNQPARPSNLGPPGSFQSRAPNPNHPPNQNMMNMPPRPGGGHMPAANPNAPRPPHPHAPRPPGHQGRPGDQQRRHSQGQGPPGGPGADQRRGSGGPQDFQRYNQQRQPDRYPNAPPNQGPPGQVQRKPPQQGMPQTYHQGGQFPNQQTFRQQPPQPGQPQHHRHPQHGQQPPVPGRDRRDSGNWGGGGAPPGAGGHRPQVPPAGQRPPGHGHPPQGGNPQGGPKPFGGGPAAGGGQGGTGQNYQQNQWKK